MPFGQGAQQLPALSADGCSRPTAQRLTEAAGVAYVAFQTAEVARLERELPEPAAGAAKLFMSVGWAHIPLVGGEWAEVKTLVSAWCSRPRRSGGDGDSHGRTFLLLPTDRLGDLPTRRTGGDPAARRGDGGCGGLRDDGAEWLQKFADHHRADAIRVLDRRMRRSTWRRSAKPVWERAATRPRVGLQAQLHELKHRGPAAVWPPPRAWWPPCPPSQMRRRSCPTWKSAPPTCSTRRCGRLAGRLAMAPWKAATHRGLRL